MKPYQPHYKKPVHRLQTILHHILLMGMLHSTFVAPAQSMLEDYFGGRTSYKSKGYSLAEPLEPSFSQESGSRGYSPVSSALLPLGKERTSFQLKADLEEGIIGVSREIPFDSPKDNLFKVYFESLPDSNRKVYLSYDLYGLGDHHSVARSINERSSVGGHMVKLQNSWSRQREELNPEWLRRGENTILFTVPENANHQYRIRNLSIEIGEPSGSFSQLVVEQRSQYLSKDDKIYVKGFLRSSHAEARVEAGGQFLEVKNGEFEGYISPEASHQGPVMLRAYDTAGLLGQEPLLIDGTIEADRCYAIEGKASAKVKKLDAFTAGSLEIEGAALIVNDSALSQGLDVSIMRLRAIDMAPLESGMVNVTGQGQGYRFLPDGLRFSHPVGVALSYDISLLPPGYSAKDIRTYYFDTDTKRWVAVQKDSLDEPGHRIISRTNHFTDYINGVIQSPESPETSAFLPTMMNDIKAADPSSEMTLISPPDASQKGSANISHPIKIPSGRRGMHPGLALQYSDEGGNGWLGEGWNLSLPAITIDTRWGLPLHDPAKETEIYNLNGEQLIYPDNYLPHRHQGSPSSPTVVQQARTTSAKTFTLRRQSFQKIERLGTNPTNYYWKVTDPDGTKSWYGAKAAADLTPGNAIIRDESGNIVHWALFMVEDVFGNNVKYTYVKPQLTGLSGPNANLLQARCFYPENIYYTGYNGSTGSYRVSFTLQTSIKQDVSLTARLGFKQADPYLLDKINISYNGQAIRSYKMYYQTGKFSKSLLSAVAELNGSNVEFYRHGFSYHDDIALNGNNLFKPAETVSLPDANANFALSFGTLLNPSDINATQTTETGYSITPEVGLQIRIGSHNNKHDETLLAGAPFGENNLKSRGKITFADINGDGLDDIVYHTNDGLRYFSNQALVSTGGLTNTFSSFLKTIHNAGEFYRSKAHTKTIFGETWDLHFTKDFYAGTQRTRTKSESEVYFTDANNDNLLDIVNNGNVYFNRIDDSTNEPTFSTSSAETPNMVITALSAVGEPALTPQEEQDEQQEEDFDDNYDVVRVWQAYADGEIRISHEAFIVGGAGQVPIAIEKKYYNAAHVQGPSCTLFTGLLNGSSGVSAVITTANGSCGPSGTPLWVNKGDRVYFRVHRNPTTPNPEINWQMRVDYISNPGMLYDGPSDPANIDYINPAYASSMITSDTGLIYLPGTGSATISWNSFNFLPKDNFIFRVVLRHFDSNGTVIDTPVYTQNCTAGLGALIASANLPITVSNPNSWLVFEAFSPTNMLSHNSEASAQWRPKLVYAPDSASQSAGAAPFDQYVVPNYSIYRPAQYKGRYYLLPPVADSNAAGWSIPGATAAYGTLPNKWITTPGILTSSDNGSFLFAVRDASNKVIGQRLVTIANGVISFPNSTTPINIGSANIGSPSYYDIGINPAGPIKVRIEYYVEGAQNIKVFEKYQLAVANRTAIIGHASSSWSAVSPPSNIQRTLAVSSFYSDNKHLGPMLNGWGQFLYNQEYEDIPGTPPGPFGKVISDALVANPQDYMDVSGSGLLNTGCDENLPADQYQDCVEQALADSLGIPAEGTDMSTIDVEGLIGDMQGLMGDFNFDLAFISLTPTRTDAVMTNDKWTGFYQSQYTGQLTMKAGGPTDPGPGSSSPSAGGGLSYEDMSEEEDSAELPPNATTGMKAINKIHRSASRAYTAGWGSLIFSDSESAYSNTVTDFMDLNGDGYPDIVTTDNIQKTNRTGGHSSAVLNPGFSNVSVEASSNTGLSINGTHLISGRKPQIKTEDGTPATSTSEQHDPGPPSNRIGAGINLGGQDKTIQYWLDVNGDGLPDRVKANGSTFTYQINKGQSVSNEVYEIYNSLSTYISKPGPLSISLGVPLLDAAATLLANEDYDISGAISVDVGYGAGTGDTESTFIDINGDGLIDLVTPGSVRYNTGNAFGATSQLTESSNALGLSTDSMSKSVSVNGHLGAFMGIPVCCTILPIVHIKGGVAFGANASLSIGELRKSFRDFNGDGYVDYLSYHDGSLSVYYSAIGRTNKLKTVTNPLGGSFSVDYQAMPKTYGNPNSKWVMSEVVINDGYNKVNDGQDSYRTRYVYENGFYDRREREFYGYETVKTQHYNVDGSGQPTTVYRTSVNKYHNQSYYLQGLLKESVVYKGNTPTALFSRNVNTYVLKELLADGTINLSSTPALTFDTGGTEGRSRAAVLLTETTNYLHELSTTPIISKVSMQYNGYGRVIKYIYQGNTTTTSDNYTTEIDYHSTSTLLSNYLIAIPKEIRVKDNANVVKRKRTTVLSSQSTGTIGSITSLISGTSVTAVTEMTYDQYGNLTKVILPPNDSAQYMFYEYTYDTAQQKYVTQVKDAYNYISSSTYNYLFDKVLIDTDLCGNVLKREYDTFGRLTKVTGPLEAVGGGGAYTIKFQYYPKYSDLSGVVSIPQASFMPVALTSHYDYQYPGNDIQTYTFMDGLTRVAQIKKDIYYNDAEAMSVSGKAEYDIFGRVVKQYHPFYEAKLATTNFVINEYASVITPSTTFYDELDRVVKTVDPEGSEVLTQYSANSSTGQVKIMTIADQTNSTDIVTEVYKDINGRVVKTSNILSGSPSQVLTTQFNYNSIGELTSYVDADNLTTSYLYDLLGRKTQVTHPDNGVTKYTYDKAGHITKLQTASLAANTAIPLNNRFINYTYDFNRLTAVTFPTTGSGANISNITYTYGSTGNNKGRVILQTDATGEQSFEYGAMGEVLYNVRTVVGPNIPTRLFSTEYGYDSFNRLKYIVYPDGEPVEYFYDKGGSLTSIKGKINNQDYYYVRNIKYDYFGQRTYLLYGNNTEMLYNHTQTLRRLNNLIGKTAQGQVMFANQYGYDKVGNVTALDNMAPAVTSNKMGGTYNHDFTYDTMNRLATAVGTYTGDASQAANNNDYNGAYSLEMEYYNTHGIKTKNQSHQKNGGTSVAANTYDNLYTNYSGTHRLQKIEENTSGVTETFTYDLNGNITNRTVSGGGAVRDFYWDESNRLRVVADALEMQHYIYDAAGERVLKAGTSTEAVYQNGTIVNGGTVVVDTYMTYPNPYIVIDGEGEYTKHYYTGSQRVVSRIGEFDLDVFDASSALVQQTESQEGRQASEMEEAQVRAHQVADFTEMLKKTKKGAPSFKAYEPAKAQAQPQTQDTGTTSTPPPPPNTPMTQIYFYHPDHLGTSTFLTDGSGEPYQFFINLPFGEAMAEQHSLTEDYETPFKFNGKEYDEETGLYYYGARYYDPKISIFISVDPLVEKTNDAYGYCYNNPINLVDPDGMAPEGSDGGGGGEDPPKKGTWLQELRKDNMLKRAREGVSEWFNENVREPLKEELKPYREEISKNRKINNEIISEKLEPLYDTYSKLGGSTGSSIVAGRKVGDAVEKGLEIYGSTAKVLGKSYQAKGEVTVAIKNTELLKELNAASKGDWVKVYEAGIKEGNKVEIHYFRNNTTNKVFDVKTKYNYWHQKQFKKIQ